MITLLSRFSFSWLHGWFLASFATSKISSYSTSMSASKEIRFPVTDFTAYTYTFRNDSLWTCACSAKEERTKNNGGFNSQGFFWLQYSRCESGRYLRSKTYDLLEKLIYWFMDSYSLRILCNSHIGISSLNIKALSEDALNTKDFLKDGVSKSLWFHIPLSNLSVNSFA